jgi:PAS domain S-box-containing protein
VLSSLRFKIIFLTIVPTTIIYFTILFLSIYQIERHETAETTRKMHQYTQYYASYYGSFLRETMQIANTSASFLQQNLQLSKSQLYTVVTKNVELNPLVFGSAIAFDYEKLSNENLFFAPYAYRTDKNIKTINIATVSDYTKSDWEWWIRAVEDNKPIWTSPFFSKERGHILMATYAVPFFDKNQLIGVTTVDVELSPLEQSVSKLLPADQEFMILTKKGDYIYNRDKETILKRSIYDDYRESGNEQIKRLADAMLSAKTGLTKISSWGKGNEDKEWVFYRPIPMTEWSFAVRVKEAEILKKTKDEVLNIAFILFISLFVIVLVIWFVIGRITAPLVRLTQNVKEIAAGKMDTIVELGGKDEIGILAKNFSQMTLDLQKRGNDLRQARSRGFSHIVRQLAGKYFYFTHDRSGEITYVSKEVEKILGYSTSQFKAHYQTYLSDSSVNRNARRKTWLLLNGRQQEPVEIEIICHHGKLHRLEIIEVPVLDENNQIIAVEGMAHDITERKKEEEKFRVLFESSSEANLLFDSEHILDCNHAFLDLFGFSSKDEILELSPCELCPEIQPDGRKSRETVSAAMLRANESNSEKILINLQSKNGAEFPSEMNITALTVSDSLFYIGVIHDMTIRLRTEQEIIQAKETAEKANKAKSDFLSNMSHELRTPLNGVLGYAQILQNNSDNTSQQIQNLDAIESCGRHLLTLINDVLDLSKIESGILEINETTFELKDFLYDVYNIVLPKAESKGIQLILELDENIPNIIRTDATKLRQILINLIGNAIKFTDQGKVTLLVKFESEQNESNNWLIFSVIDSGIGMSIAEQTNIFDAFKQTKQGVEAGGTGLGLAISRHLARILGYTDIHLKSEQGKGSSFTFSMPLVSTQSQQITEEHTWSDRKIPILESNQNFSVLVVDDRDINRDILVNFLQISGFDVKQADSGEQAIKMAMQGNFSLILMDIKMPGMNGIEAVRYLRNTEKYQSTSIFAITANVLPELREEIYRVRFNDIVHKPIRISELFGKIRIHMKIRFKQQDGSLKETQKVLKNSVESERLNNFVGKLKTASSYGDIEMLNQLLKEYKAICQMSGESEKELERLINNFEFRKIEIFAENLLEQYK